MLVDKKIISLILLSFMMLNPVVNGIKVKSTINVNIQQQEESDILEKKFVDLVEKSLKFAVLMKDYKKVAELIHKYEIHLKQYKNQDSYNFKVATSITKNINYAKEIIKMHMNEENVKKIENVKKKFKDIEKINSNFFEEISKKIKEKDFSIDVLTKDISQYNNINKFLVDGLEDFDNLLVSDYDLIELKTNVKINIIQNLNTVFSNYIKRGLSYIKESLITIKRRLNNVRDKEKNSILKLGKEFYELEKKYNKIAQLITTIKKQQFNFDIYNQLIKISIIIIEINKEIKDDIKILIGKFKNFFVTFKENLISYKEKITEKGVWEEIKKFFIKFNRTVYNFKKIQDLNKSEIFSELQDLIQEIKLIFSKTKYRGLDHIQFRTKEIEFYIDEDKWNTFKIVTGVLGISLLVFSTSGEIIGKIIANKISKTSYDVVENILPVEGVINKVPKGFKWVNYCTKIGIFLSLFFLVIPTLIISFIKTNGAGVKFFISYKSLMGLTLGAASSALKTYQPQEIKTLDYVEIDDEIDDELDEEL